MNDNCSQNKFECQTKGAFIPTILTLHPDKSLIFSANEKGLIQCWDIALNQIYLTLSAEADYNLGGSNILDIGHNFNRIPIGLCDMKWCEKSKFNPTFMETMAFNYLCLRYERKTNVRRLVILLLRSYSLFLKGKEDPTSTVQWPR